MMIFFALVLLAMIVLLGLASLRWGVSSIDAPDSPEWERRHNWYGFH